MKGFLRRYKNLSFEERTMFHARFSIIFNIVLAAGKILLGFFANSVFFVTAVVNIFMMLSRYECFLGATQPQKKSFTSRNKLIATFLILAGIQYTGYMGLFLFSRIDSREYSLYLGTIIAFISFVELGVAIKGCFNAYGRGHYYRNIKLINLCSAFTAMVLTEMAILSFTSPKDHRVADGCFGIGVGCIIILMGIYVLVSPKISIIDHKHHIYNISSDSKFQNLKKLEYPLTASKFYGNFYYVATINNDKIEGDIVQYKNPFFRLPIYLKIIFIMLSEILIFPYAIGAFIFHIKSVSIIKKLDRAMLEAGCTKIEESEEELIANENF